jgi:Type I restriction enzyme R protein N terminus (HSDR_N)
MTFELPRLTDLQTESDVEQKLIFPFLVADQPFGLGISPSEILTKKDIRRLSIGKGKQRKSYFPDYLILIGGLPLVVIEAKDPNADLDEGFREARLYAAEVNAIFQPGLNPLTTVVAINGNRLLAGVWDHSKPQISMNYPEFTVSSEKMAALHAMVDRDALQKEFAALSGSIKPKRLWKPRRMNGGPASQDEEIPHNTFGVTISAEFAHIFNPTTIEDRVRIARTAYIPSKRRERYVDPIDKVIRASRPPSETSSLLIEDTASPREILQKLEAPKQLEHQVLLIVGGVGVGKTTFIDHLQYVALPKDLMDTTVWVRINLNFAPASSNEIYAWLRKEIVAGCRSAYPDLDFDTLKTMKAVFSVEVRRFEKGIGVLYKDDPNLYKQKLAETLQQLSDDLHQKAVAHTRYCSTERGRLLILVVDNCDKRTLDQQLLMFEAAQWIQKEFRALVILPLREETYDNHRDKPPLDTALKDLVFRIEPPLFHQVLVSRVQMALNEINKSGAKTFRYELPNGFHVEYPQSDKAYYLTSIVHAIFEHDRQIRRIILGLSGRNIRRALEMFLEFCTSGISPRTTSSRSDRLKVTICFRFTKSNECCSG